MSQTHSIQRNMLSGITPREYSVPYGSGFTGTAQALESGTNRQVDSRPLDNIIAKPGRPPFANSTTTISAAVIRPDLPFYGHQDEKDGLYGSAGTFAPRSGFNRLKTAAAKPVTDAAFSLNSSCVKLRHATASVFPSPTFSTTPPVESEGCKSDTETTAGRVVQGGDFFTWTDGAGPHSGKFGKANLRRSVHFSNIVLQGIRLGHFICHSVPENGGGAAPAVNSSDVCPDGLYDDYG